MSVVESPVYPFLVSVSVTVIIVARLSSLTLRVAALVRPAFNMDIHLVTVEVGFIHEAFTTVSAEISLFGVVFMCRCQMSLEVLDNFPTEMTGLWIVNSDVVLLFVLF